MKHTVNIRTKVIISIVLFTIAIFSLVQYQHNNIVIEQLTRSEAAKNTLLLDTIEPVLTINLAFGLNSANAGYLDDIAAKNPNILLITLKDHEGTRLYQYINAQDEHHKTPVKRLIETRSLHDEATKSPIGTLELHFSNIYYDQLLAKHQEFTLKFFIVILLLLTLFVLFLRRAFKPLQTLLGQIEGFDPQNNAYDLQRTRNNDEVGIIQNAFAAMIGRIKRYTDEVDELTKNLEQKVQERTSQLSAKKAVLESKIIEIQEQEKMLISQSRLAAMGEMMSMIAHQWRQPLSTTTLMISKYTINAMLNDTPKDERDEILEKVSDTMLYLSNTVDDFQTYFKPEKSEEEISLCSVIERALHFTKTRLELNKITVESHCDEAHKVHTYINELIQVLINIINNGIDAISAVNPEKRVISISSVQEEGAITLAISDSGGGIDEAIINQVFEPYFSTKSKNGTGLGLYMAKMIIEKHTGGTISVENTAEGACFKIRLFTRQA